MKLTIDLSPQEEADIAGWVNFYRAHPETADYPTRLVLSERTRARLDQIAAQFAPPTPADVLWRFRAAPSQWAKWRFATSEEICALLAIHNPNDVHQRVNFYSNGGGGNVQGQARTDGTYWFWKTVGGHEVLTLDVGGAADDYVAAVCAGNGTALIGPLG